MEPQLTTPPSVPLPPSALVKEFHKSKVIVIFAYIIIGLFILRLSTSLRMNGSFSSVRVPILSLIPAFLVILGKGTVYKVGKALLIIELLLIPAGIILLFIIFGAMHW